MKNIGYLAAGYMVVWSGLLLYLWRLLSIQNGLQRRLAVLEEGAGPQAGDNADDPE